MVSAVENAGFPHLPERDTLKRLAQDRHRLVSERQRCGIMMPGSEEGMLWSWAASVTWGLVQACLCQGDGDLKHPQSCVALKAALIHSCADGCGPTLGFKGTQQAALALMTNEMAHIVVRLGPVRVKKRRKLEGQCEAVTLPYSWYHM